MVPAAAPGGNPGLCDVLYSVTVSITNTGPAKGEEVPQFYVSLGGPNDPNVVLRGFDCLSIEPGETVTFVTDFQRRDLSNWNIDYRDWVISSHPKRVYVGPSSRNLPLTQALRH
jgi:Fibronectin type III-like domain